MKEHDNSPVLDEQNITKEIQEMLDSGNFSKRCVGPPGDRDCDPPEKCYWGNEVYSSGGTRCEGNRRYTCVDGKWASSGTCGD